MLFALDKQGECAVTVGGRSMWPFIRPNDRIRIVPHKPLSLRAGQVVAFFENDQLIVHRILWPFTPGRWSHVWVCGDSSPGSRTAVPTEKIIGVVCDNRIWFHFPGTYLALAMGFVLRLLAGWRAR
jgi:hypothetical protein